MRDSFKVQVTGKEHVVVRLSGEINEMADLSAVRLPVGLPVEIDMSAVTSINSMGIRSFREWALKVSNATFHFSYCPKVFIDQLNMIRGMLPPQARVISFYVPFFSETTGEEKNHLYIQGEHFKIEGGEVKIFDPVMKDANGMDMELDVIPAKYFSFLNSYI